MTDQKTPIIILDKVSRCFGKDEAATTVIKDITLEIYAGEFIIFFGPSGCGKSTLLNLIAGLDSPSQGKVEVRSRALNINQDRFISEHRREKIGMIFQQFNVLRTMNVLENVALPQMFNRVSKKVREKRAQKLLANFGLEKHLYKIPSELSGGQQQRVAIARALANNPWIIIADEPTGNLDSKSADEVMDFIYRLNTKSRRTVILVTHNPDHLHYASRVFYLKDGIIIKEVQQKKHQVEVDEDEMRKDSLGEMKFS